MRALWLWLWIALASFTMSQTSYAEPEANLEDYPDIELPAPANAPPPDAAVEHITEHISRKIRCPVCQGAAISDSPAPSAVNMRKHVRQLVTQGYTETQILDYFSLRFGDWVLLSPKPEGLNWIIWFFPPILGGLGLAWLGLVTVRWRAEPDVTPLPSDTGSVSKDPYEARLLEELER